MRGVQECWWGECWVGGQYTLGGKLYERGCCISTSDHLSLIISVVDAGHVNGVSLVITVYQLALLSIVSLCCLYTLHFLSYILYTNQIIIIVNIIMIVITIFKDLNQCNYY